MSEKKNQLHQLLAVEAERRNKAVLITQETIGTFQKRADHFDGLIKTYESLRDAPTDLLLPSEIKEVVTTVREKIDYTKKSIIIAMDAQVSKEETNAFGEVRADLRVGDQNSFGEFSSTALLALEQQMIKIRNMYHAIPTLDPTKVWLPDPTAGRGIYSTSIQVSIRGIKEEIPLVMYEATKEHPAQVQLVKKDVQVGKWNTFHKSGKITPAEKSELLSRIDLVIDAIKRARARANQAEVKQVHIGKKIFDYINKGII